MKCFHFYLWYMEGLKEVFSVLINVYLTDFMLGACFPVQKKIKCLSILLFFFLVSVDIKAMYSS